LPLPGFEPRFLGHPIANLIIRRTTITGVLTYFGVQIMVISQEVLSELICLPSSCELQTAIFVSRIINHRDFMFLPFVSVTTNHYFQPNKFSSRFRALFLYHQFSNYRIFSKAISNLTRLSCSLCVFITLFHFLDHLNIIHKTL